MKISSRLRVCLHVAILCLVGSLFGWAAPLAATVKTQAIEAMKQWSAGNYEAYADFLYPTMLDSLGGRAKAPGWIKQSAERLKASWKITREIGEPSLPVTAGGKAFAVVPLVIRMESPHQTSVTRSYLVAVSADAGTTWKFVDCTTEDPASVRESLVPDLPVAVALPAHEDPQLTDK